MEKNERNFVGAVGAEAGAEKRYARTVGALDGFYFFAGNFGRDDAGAGGQANFQKWLRLIFYRQFYFGERFAFDRDERGDDGAFGDGGQHAGIGEAGPRKREGGRFAGLAVITKRGLQREAGERAEVG